MQFSCGVEQKVRTDVNHDQFSHFPEFRPGLPVVILQVVVILLKSSLSSFFGPQIGLGSRGAHRQTVYAVELCG